MMFVRFSKFPSQHYTNGSTKERCQSIKIDSRRFFRWEEIEKLIEASKVQSTLLNLILEKVERFK